MKPRAESTPLSERISCRAVESLRGVKFVNLRARANRFAALAVLIHLLSTLLGVQGPPASAVMMKMCDVDFGCYPSPSLPPPSTCGHTNLPSLAPTISISGKVLGPGGVGIDGACVYWSDGVSSASVKTDLSGAYSIAVLADRDVTLYAHKSLYTWNAVTIPKSGLLVAAASAINFNLSFLHASYASPKSLNNNAQKTIEFSMYMTAPEWESRVLLHLHTGDVLSLAQDLNYGIKSGWTRWAASWLVPVGTADGRYEFRSCVLRLDATGTCDTPQGVVLSSVEPADGRPHFVVDSVAPAIQPWEPLPDHNTVYLRPTISSAITDPLAGVDSASVKLLLDGVQVAAYYSAGAVYFSPSSDLALGTHKVTVTASDLAGNTASLGWSFNVAALSATTADATVTPKTVLVNPNKYLTPPSWVFIEGAQTTLAAYDLAISGSPLWSGSGTILRSVDYIGLKATFRNEMGQAISVDAPTAYATFYQDIAVIEPNQGAVGVNLPATSSTLSGVWVKVPTQFIVTDQATVTLSGGSHPANHSLIPKVGGDPLPGTLDCGPSTECVVTGVVTCSFSRTGAETAYSCNGTYPRTTLERTTSGSAVNPFSVLAAVVQEDARVNSSTFGKTPNPNPVDSGNCGSGFSCTNALNSSYNAARLTPYWSTGNLFRAYGHHYYFHVTSIASDHIGSWQASDVTPGTAPCRKALLRDFGNAVESKSDWSTTGTTSFAPSIGAYDQGFTDTDGNPVDYQDVELLRNEGSSLAYRVGGVGVGWNVDMAPVMNAKKLRGDYLHELGKTLDPNGNVVSAQDKASYNLWKPSVGTSLDPVDYRDRHAEVMTGTEFKKGTSNDFSFRSLLYFQFDLVEAC